MARRRRREHEAVFPKALHWSRGLDPLYGWEIPKLNIDTATVQQFKGDRHSTLGESLLHAWLVVAAQRLERNNGPAAWQLWQDYATFRVIYAKFRADHPDKLIRFVEWFFEYVQRRKSIGNRRDQYKRPPAMRALALFQYRRMLPAVQAAQRTMTTPDAMHQRLRELLDWTGREGQALVLPQQLVRDALLPASAFLVTRQLVALVHHDIATVLRKASEYETNPFYIWLDEELPPIP